MSELTRCDWCERWFHYDGRALRCCSDDCAGEWVGYTLDWTPIEHFEEVIDLRDHDE